MLAKTPEEHREPPTPQPEKRLRTITLTNRRPVQIIESEWPVIAEGGSGCGGRGAPYECTVNFKVRKGNYGRRIIHGKFSWCDEERDEEDVEQIRVGRLLYFETDDVDKALHEVGQEMLARIRHQHLKVWATLALDSCFASLAPQLLYAKEKTA